MSSESFPIDEAHIISIFTQDICYGVYLVTLFLTLKALIFSSEGPSSGGPQYATPQTGYGRSGMGATSNSSHGTSSVPATPSPTTLRHPTIRNYPPHPNSNSNSNSNRGFLPLRSSINWFLVGIVLLMGVLATMSTSLALRENLQAFVGKYGAEIGRCGNGEERIFVENSWMSILAIGVVQAQTLLADGILLYRCYVLTNRKWAIVAAPILLWFATLGFSIAILVRSSLLFEYPSLSNYHLQGLVIARLTVTATQTLMTTGILVYRIWTVDRDSSRWVIKSSNSNSGSTSTGTKLQRIIRIFIDSGFIYVFTAFITLLTAVKGNNADYVTCSIVKVPLLSFALLLWPFVRSSLVLQWGRLSHDMGSSCPWSPLFIPHCSTLIPILLFTDSFTSQFLQITGITFNLIIIRYHSITNPHPNHFHPGSEVQIHMHTKFNEQSSLTGQVPRFSNVTRHFVNTNADTSPSFSQQTLRGYQIEDTQTETPFGLGSRVVFKGAGGIDGGEDKGAANSAQSSHESNQ